MSRFRTTGRDFGLIGLDSEWPTVPQVYVGGEFIGGCDIVLGSESSAFSHMFFWLTYTLLPSASIRPAFRTPGQARHNPQNTSL